MKPFCGERAGEGEKGTLRTAFVSQVAANFHAIHTERRSGRCAPLRRRGKGDCDCTCAVVAEDGGAVAEAGVVKKPMK